MIGTLVLFGATGDLAGRLLLPALAAVHAAGRLPEGFCVVGAAPEPWDDDAFRAHVDGWLSKEAGDVAPAAREALLRTVAYRQADATDPDDVATLVRAGGGDPLAVYLAVPPAVFGPALAALGAAGLPAGSRVALEKPFGDDLDDAVRLNGVVRQVFGGAGEDVVFRVDHALGMATVENLLALRRRSTVLGAVWDARHIAQVEVRWEEDLALEGRAGYYDSAGALRDVLQNHMLQVLCVAAMEPPDEPGERALRDARVAVLDAMRPPRAEESARRTRRARYGAGRIGDRAIPAYAEEEGVDPGRATETFAEVVLSIDLPRWAGTRFVLRAGKALAHRRKEVVVRFRPGQGDVLRVGIDDPYDIVLGLVGSEPLTLTGPRPREELPPYGRVLLDLLDGGSALSVRGDEAEAAWRVVMPVLDAWREDRVPLEEYPAGSSGPPPLV